MSRTLVRVLAATLSLSLMLMGVACSDDGDDGSSDEPAGQGDGGEAIDYEALGLWDDGPCDEAREPLVIGLMTVFESGVLSLEDQALALEASAEAFNARGGANGACIEVHTCDDGANLNQAVACVREIDEAGVVATVNDQGTAGQAEVSAAMAQAGIPRVASNVTSNDWGDQNAYPLDASGTGVTFLLPQALIEEDVTELGLIRVDLPQASALTGLLVDIYEDDGASFPLDVPVPAGTTDYSQFILAAQDEGVGGVTLALGEQEAVQVVKAAQQLSTDLLIGSSLGTFSQATVAELGDFADQMVFLWSYPPATFDLPVYEALRDDLAASGEESLQPENLKASPMRSWIGLYALIRMIRDAGMNEFSREGISTMLNQATDVPMLDIFGGEDWTPALNHPGAFQRAGTNHWAIWKWDPEAEGNGVEGNFVQRADISFDEVLCGSPFGAPGPC
ncbi:MAG TPA: ABC transporter substrate-binding protein [Acidimicrobiales bacterium]|nr:ABC transporter substrate-binding protein [Acidimicrobiales bacterium]